MKLLNEILGTKYPIIQGGMANIATGKFAAACSNAGALGLIGSGGMDADALRENIRHCRALTDQPFGVNIMLMHPQADEFAKIVVEEGVKIVTTGAGNPGKYMAMWKAAGITVIPVVAAAILAKHLEPLGIDAVIAEGTESGGHVGEMTTMALVPQVVDAVHVPVIAAGGIADGRSAGAGGLRRAGRHLSAGQHRVPHPRKLQGGAAESPRQRYHCDRADRRHPGACVEKPNEPRVCPAGKSRGRQNGAGTLYAWQSAQGCV